MKILPRKYFAVFAIGFFLASAYSLAFAQAPKYYTVQPGQNMTEVIPASDFYEFAQFERGFVHFKSGARSQSRLNYNLLYEELFFLNMQGDTLTLANPEEVKVVTINRDSFYFTGSRFVKTDTLIGETRIATASFFTSIGERKVGAYGTTTDAVTNYYNSYVMPSIAKLDLIPQVITTYIRSKAMYIGDKYNKFEPLTKESLMNFYSSKSGRLREYLKNNKVNYTDRNNVIALITYMNSTN